MPRVFFQTRHGRRHRLLNILSKYKIGKLHPEEQVEEDAFEEDFLEELVKTCQKKNLYQPAPRRKKIFDTIRILLLAVNLLIIATVFYVQTDWKIAIPLVIIQALTSASLFGFIAHEHTHTGLPRNKILKTCLYGIWPVLWPFISRKALIYEHNSHHVKIGDPEYDYEVIGFSHFIRYSGNIKHRFIHRVQHFVALFWYMLYANIITTVGGIFTSFWNTHNKKVALNHNISILITLSVFILIPGIIHGNILYCSALYLVFQCVLFTFIYTGAAINHFTPLANKLIPDEYRNKFGYYVCHNTTNFSPESTFWFYLTGGFNIQIEHHLCASVPVENLRELQKIVRELCQKYNYPYIEYRSFTELYRAHYQYLADLSINQATSSVMKEAENKQAYQAR